MKEPSASSNPRLAQTRTLGPIPDLERHLPTEWWKSLFKAMYLKTDGDVVENEQNTIDDIDLLVKLSGLRPEMAVLDLCCGQGRHCLELASRGCTNVTGVDRSRYLVRLARRRNRRSGMNVTFKEGDARKVRLPQGTFDCVTLFGNSFGYFERSEDDLAVLRNVFRLMKPGGMVLLDITDGESLKSSFEPRSWEWVDQVHFVCRERALASDGRRLISREIITHAEKGVIADQFYAERLYTFSEIKALLEKAGFTDVARHDGPNTASTRNQDLGMMASRMFIVAWSPKDTGSKRRTAPLFPNVTVLLGDPRRPDTVKLGGQFNEEDHATVDRLKESLASIPGYAFRYLDNHAEMADRLKAEPPQFVLNLCDEGYFNDALKELHVPAMLEVTGIPYSGAAAACLGMCYDKALVRALAASLDIPVPLESYYNPDDQAATLPSVFPALLKPNLGDSSLGITAGSVVRSPEEFMTCWNRLRSEFPDRPLLVQEFLEGSEYSVGILGNPGQNMNVLPVLEVDYSELDPELPRILGYESKWMPDSPYWTQISYKPATLKEDKQRGIVDASMLLFERLGCRDYARFDFRADSEGAIKLLEVNPNPGWCWDGKLNIMAGFADMSYADMLRLILEAGQARYEWAVK